MMEDKSIKKTFRLSPQVVKALEELAAERGVNQKKIVEELILNAEAADKKDSTTEILSKLHARTAAVDINMQVTLELLASIAEYLKTPIVDSDDSSIFTDAVYCAREKINKKKQAKDWKSKK